LQKHYEVNAFYSASVIVASVRDHAARASLVKFFLVRLGSWKRERPRRKGVASLSSFWFV
jgi:hypothetical protein